VVVVVVLIAAAAAAAAAVVNNTAGVGADFDVWVIDRQIVDDVRKLNLK